MMIKNICLFVCLLFFTSTVSYGAPSKEIHSEEQDPESDEATAYLDDVPARNRHRVKRQYFQPSNLWIPKWQSFNFQPFQPFQPAQSCSPLQFKCTNGNCLKAEQECDGIQDCGDGTTDQDSSDERHCAKPCTPLQFQCSNGNCIKATKKCDGIQDCGDETTYQASSDERHCVCSETEFKCANGLCISQSRVCDEKPDCLPGDGEDEQDCKEATTTPAPVPNCFQDEYECNDGECIPLSYQCDNFEDCDDGDLSSDEENCDCPEDFFICDNGFCIPDYWLCDDYPDCREEEDELFCKCSSDQLTCTSGECLDSQVKCNGIKECADGYDEENCPIEEPFEPTDCSKGFECSDGQYCLDESEVCDGERDCGDFSDEDSEKCGDLCPFGYISCNGDGTEPCIPLHWWCDDYQDCDNNYDDVPSRCTECPYPNIQCDNGRRCLHTKAGCDMSADCEDGSDEPDFTEWSSWISEQTGSLHCPKACEAGFRYRKRTCLNNCDLECAQEERQLEQRRICPKIGCFTEATSGYGSRPAVTATRIVGGDTANEGTWPWQIQLFRDKDGAGSGQLLAFTCGGSLIEPDVVLTAAHCFSNKPKEPEYWAVHVGKHRRSSWIPSESDGIMVPVKYVILHELYDDDTSDNDIALLILANKVDRSNTVNPVRLNPVNVANRKFFDRSSECYITGWGTVEEDGYLADELQEAHVPLWPHKFCYNNHYFLTDGGSWITNNMICAGHDEFAIDACQGDSGGPLVCLAEDDSDGPQPRLARWYLVGVTSWGFGCARKGRPGIYARVDNYLEWIQDKISSTTN